MKKLIAVLMVAFCLSGVVSPAVQGAVEVVAADKATENAYRSAKNYLKVMAFSRKGLIEQLSSDYGDQYTVEQATAAVNMLEKNKEVNWKKQAVRAGKEYLNVMGYSRQGLIDQLSSDYGSKFTKKQAVYAADKLGL